MALAIALGIYFAVHHSGPESSVPYAGSLMLVVAYLLIGGSILVASRGRGTFKLSLAIFAAFGLGCLGLGTADAVGYHARTSATESAYAHRESLLEKNNDLSLQGTAVLDRSLLTGSEQTQLLVTAVARRYDIGPLPTTEVITEEEWLDDRSREGDWLLEASSNKVRRWIYASVGVDLLLCNRGATTIDVSRLTRHLVLVNEDGDTECLGLLRKTGRYWTSLPAKLEPGGSLKGVALFALDDPDEEMRESMAVAIALPTTEYRYHFAATDSDGWVRSPSGDSEYSWNEVYYPNEPSFAASWRIPEGDSRWVKVAVYSGTGGEGPPNDERAFTQARSPAFMLTSGQFKLRWSIKPYGGYTSYGPYILVDVRAVNPISYAAEPNYMSLFSLVETDYYHTGSRVFDDNQAAGKYVFRVAAANCRWRLVLWQERWR